MNIMPVICGRKNTIEDTHTHTHLVPTRYDTLHIFWRLCSSSEHAEVLECAACSPNARFSKEWLHASRKQRAGHHVIENSRLHLKTFGLFIDLTSRKDADGVDEV